jgi:hypothetical protein
MASADAARQVCCPECGSDDARFEALELSGDFEVVFQARLTEFYFRAAGPDDPPQIRCDVPKEIDAYPLTDSPKNRSRFRWRCPHGHVWRTSHNSMRRVAPDLSEAIAAAGDGEGS